MAAMITSSPRPVLEILFLVHCTRLGVDPLGPIHTYRQRHFQCCLGATAAVVSLVPDAETERCIP
jgi:hypothetical protein